jgi:hypothetical protein
MPLDFLPSQHLIHYSGGCTVFRLNLITKKKLKIFFFRKKKHFEKYRKEIKESRKIVKKLR